VSFYKDAGAGGAQAACGRCGRPYASAMMIRDLITVERDLGFSYEMPGSAVDHYQQICPRCRRSLFGLAQGREWSERLTERLEAK
jgi:ribosomal protein S27AE